MTEHRKREHLGQFKAIIVDNLKKKKKSYSLFFAPDETSILPLHVDQI